MAVAFLLDSIPAILLLLFAILFVARLAGKSLQYTLRSLRPILFLSLFAVAINIFRVSGTPLAEQGILSHLSLEGACIAAKMVLRLLTVAGCASLLTFTTSPLSLTDALERVMKPLAGLRVPVHEIAMMITISMRFIPTIHAEADRISRAQASRCPDLAGGTALGRASNCLPLILPLMVGAFRRGDDLATAMEARCYSGARGRTRMRPLEFSSADLMSASVVLVFLTTLFVVEYARF
jgi:energy-coupling factor transport system permease protein